MDGSRLVGGGHGRDEATAAREQLGESWEMTKMVR